MSSVSSSDRIYIPEQGSWGQHGAHLGPTGPRWAPCWPHKLCYLGCFMRQNCMMLLDVLPPKTHYNREAKMFWMPWDGSSPFTKSNYLLPVLPTPLIRFGWHRSQGEMTVLQTAKDTHIYSGVNYQCLEVICNPSVEDEDSPDSKVHRANMGPTWGRPDPGGPHVGHMNLAIWVYWVRSLTNINILV